MICNYLTTYSIFGLVEHYTFYFYSFLLKGWQHHRAVYGICKVLYYVRRTICWSQNVDVWSASPPDSICAQKSYRKYRCFQIKYQSLFHHNDTFLQNTLFHSYRVFVYIFLYVNRTALLRSCLNIYNCSCIIVFTTS